MRRVIVYLPQGEMEALKLMSEEECRPLDQQLRFLFQREAKQRGLVKNEGNGARLDNEPVTLGLNT